MRIWIDLSNSPHPLLFSPITRRLQELGHQVGITARDHAQTLGLTIDRWPDAAIIGGPSPKSRVQKARVMLERIGSLRQWARSFAADVALSHNSYGQIVAARTLSLNIVTAMDYEGQPANHVAFRLADKILMPVAMRGSAVRRQGATATRTRFYSGFKEEIYLGDFEPDMTALASIGVEADGRALVVARTPPTRAIYHRFENPLFVEAMEALGNDPGICLVVLARYPEQQKAIRALGLRQAVVPDHATDSRTLMHEADLVIGAGGTMTREAALMGIPTYSVFAGKQAAVDRELERQHRLQRLTSVDQLLPVKPRAVQPRTIQELRIRATDLVETFVDATLERARGRST